MFLFVVVCLFVFVCAQDIAIFQRNLTTATHHRVGKALRRKQRNVRTHSFINFQIYAHFNNDNNIDTRNFTYQFKSRPMISFPVQRIS